MVAIPAAAATGCSQAFTPHWEKDALIARDHVKTLGADAILSEEFKSVDEAVAKGKTLLRQDEQEDAETYFHLAWTKGMLLEMNLAAEKSRLARVAKLKAEEAEAEMQRKEREAQDALRETQRLHIPQDAEKTARKELRNKTEKNRQQKEKSLPSFHTVKNGETLPQIAAQPEVFNDQSLWPLLYRANRDQIRDPRHIWPGQVLRIPRNSIHDDVVEARRYGQEKSVR